MHAYKCYDAYLEIRLSSLNMWGTRIEFKLLSSRHQPQLDKFWATDCQCQPLCAWPGTNRCHEGTGCQCGDSFMYCDAVSQSLFTPQPLTFYGRYLLWMYLKLKLPSPSLLWDCPSEVTFRATPPGMDLPFSSVVYLRQPSSFPLQELDAFQPYPAEIMPGKIFLGKFSQACNAKIHKDLKIKAHVNVSMEATP